MAIWSTEQKIQKFSQNYTLLNAGKQKFTTCTTYRSKTWLFFATLPLTVHILMSHKYVKQMASFHIHKTYILEKYQWMNFNTFKIYIHIILKQIIVGKKFFYKCCLMKLLIAIFGYLLANYEDPLQLKCTMMA